METLPPEILSLIFVRALPEYVCEPTSKRRDATLASICTVNRHWKDSAYSTPDLWSWIIVDETYRHANPPLVERLLARSGSVPLDIWVLRAADRFSFQDLMARFNRSLELLKQQANRWRSLLVINPRLGLTMAEILPATVGDLRSIYMDGLPLMFGKGMPDVPNISSIYTNSALLFRVLNFRPEKIKYLSVAPEQRTWSEVFNSLLQHCPNVENLEVLQQEYSFYGFGSVDQPWPTFVQLRRLRLFITEGSLLVGILDNLGLPTLEELQIEGIRRTMRVPANPTPVRRFAAQAPPTLAFAKADIKSIRTLLRRFALPGDFPIHLHSHCGHLPRALVRPILKRLRAAGADTTWYHTTAKDILDSGEAH